MQIKLTPVPLEPSSSINTNCEAIHSVTTARPQDLVGRCCQWNRQPRWIEELHFDAVLITRKVAHKSVTTLSAEPVSYLLLVYGPMTDMLCGQAVKDTPTSAFEDRIGRLVYAETCYQRKMEHDLRRR
jgi:hypothetical protein